MTSLQRSVAVMTLLSVYFQHSGEELHKFKTNDEKLIKLFRSHYELYDFSHPKYMDTTYIKKEYGTSSTR